MAPLMRDIELAKIQPPTTLAVIGCEICDDSTQHQFSHRTRATWAGTPIWELQFRCAKCGNIRVWGNDSGEESTD